MQARNFASTVLLIVIACLLVWNGTSAHPTVAAAVPTRPTVTGSISVSGSSAIRVQPDRIVVIFGVESFARTPSSAQAQNARRSRAVLDAIHTQDIAERDVATANFIIQPRYDDYDRNIISGYGARNTIAVTLRDVQKLEPVLVAALEAGATTVDGIDFSVTNLRELRDRARDQAVQAALEKARDMSSAAGLTMGDITSIHEGSGFHYFGSWHGNRQWTNVQNVVQDLSAEGAITLEDGSISLGQIVVQAQVSLTAELVTDAKNTDIRTLPNQ
ncbi:MAG: SIMPL domain-containing protein [Chloroflexota bacterium]|nr:SIMPL domain-containing protein [Chloroflexota bacterium]